MRDLWMTHRERQQRDDEQRTAQRASVSGMVALVLMLALILLAGMTSLFRDPAVLLGLSLLICPVAGWLAARCLVTRGTKARLHACIALILIGLFIGGQIVSVLPYFAPSTWD